MQFVLLALQVIEEATHAEKAALASNHQLLMLRIKLDPRHIERNAGLLREALQVGEQRTILRLGPRFDRSLRQSFRFVRNHQVKVEIDSVAESLTARTRAIRIIER